MCSTPNAPRAAAAVTLALHSPRLATTRFTPMRPAPSRRAARACVAASAAMLSCVALVGCEINKPAPPPEVLSAQPLIVDEAMQQREWEVTSAQYSNPRVVAGPTGFTFRPSGKLPPLAFNLADPVFFLVNLVTLPVALCVTPPWTAVDYRGSTVNPSYSAQPPLPPEKGSTNGIPPEVPAAAIVPAGPSETAQPAATMRTTTGATTTVTTTSPVPVRVPRLGDEPKAE